jgi:exodeoxyribonuclease V gamma subunit
MDALSFSSNLPSQLAVRPLSGTLCAQGHGAGMFYLYHHHDLERLLDLLSALQGHYRAAPLMPDTVLVPNRGIARWLQVRMAERHGIAANLEFPLPARFFWQLLSQSLPDTPDSSAYEQEHLRWHLYAALPDIAREVPRIAHYLDSGTPELSRLQLAERLADVFDEYLIYRRDMLAAWERHDGENRPPADWQAPVWRALVAQLGGRHRAQLLSEFIDASTSATALDRSAWPERLYCFGLGSLPPDYLRLLYVLGRERDVHFLLPNPSDQYWGDSRARRSHDVDRTAGGAPAADGLPLPAADGLPLPAADGLPLPAADGHPLLAALGRSGRDLLRVLYADELSAIQEPELGEAMAYEPPGCDTLLHRLQSGLMRMEAMPAHAGMAAGDRSLQIHACHGPLREIQVLHDQLLDLLACHPDLEARDVLVMVPDVGAYAPAIHSVFGGARDARRMPYTVCDRPRLTAHPIVQTFRSLLSLPLWRWTASEVMTLAAVPAVMRRFGLDEADVHRLRHWVGASGVRWGLDAGSREAADAGQWAQNSWRFGLDRLLLGIGLADAREVVDGVAPFSDLEGGATAALGRLWLLLERLGAWRDRLRAAATPAVWRDRLNRMIEQLFLEDRDDAEEAAALALLFETLRVLEGAERCLARTTLSWEAMREVLDGALAQSGERQPFLAGGVNFCGMVPLRTVPFRVIALLGLNDGEFPRQDAHRSLNLARLYPRLGDRSMRDDDRLLFLQSIMAARDVLYLSYTGQDVRSGEMLPPSPVVGELLEFLQRYHFPELSGEQLRERLITRQPMQPFSARYLSAASAGSEARVMTFSSEWRAGTRAMFEQRVPAAPFVDDSSLVPAVLDVVEVTTLRSFFMHPARYFFRESLRLDFERGPGDRLADDEPLALGGLAAYQLRDELLAHACEHGELAPVPDVLMRARGVLPPSPLDVPAYAEVADDVNALLPVWHDWHRHGTVAALDLDLALPGGMRLTGRLNDVWPDGLRRVRPGRLGLRNQLGPWIDYLALRASGQPGVLRLAGIDRGRVHVMRAEIDPATARAHLVTLVELYQEGLTRPLIFLPELSGKFMEEQSPARSRKPVTADVALAARNQYLADPHRTPHELRDPFFCMTVCAPEFLGNDPELVDFCRLARAVCAPLVEHLVEESAQ